MSSSGKKQEGRLGNLLLAVIRRSVRLWLSLPSVDTPDRRFLDHWLRLQSMEKEPVAPQSETGRSLLEFWFGVQQLADIQINQICNQYYDSKHPKHYLWLGHNQYLYDGVSEGERVLDIGCGASYYQQWIAGKAAEVVGIDILPDRIEQARRNNEKPNLRFELMDATEKLPGGRFDVAICSHVIEHMDDPIPLLSNLARNIPRLLIKVPLVDSHWMKLVKRDIEMFYLDDASHKREYTEDLLREQLIESGWHIIEMIRGYDLRATAVSPRVSPGSETS